MYNLFVCIMWLFLFVPFILEAELVSLLFLCDERAMVLIIFLFLKSAQHFSLEFVSNNLWND
ncbi:UNVERIFIED_CONTAM: hypothetical protein ABID98_005192 [Brevibacillus sp. OAP136]